MTAVDIPGLVKVGGDVEHAATTFARASTAHADQLGDGHELHAFTTGAAMSKAAQAWTAFLKQLADQVQHLGADLGKAARDYQGADADAAGRARQAGASLGNPAYGEFYGSGPR